MNYFFLSLIIILSINGAAQTKAKLRVVISDSKIFWTGTKVVGFHQGTVQLKEGSVELRDQRLVGGYFIIDLTTVKCTDIPDSDPIPKNKLEAHLKSDEFFNVTSFPTAKFVITEVRKHPDSDTKLFAQGELTIKGITRELKIEVEPSTMTDKLFIAQADIRFDRQLWGVAYKGIKDELVHDEVKLNVIIKAK